MALTKVIGSGIGTVTDNVVITSDDPTITMTDSSGTNDIVTLQSTSGALIVTVRDGTSDGEIIFKGNTGSAVTEHARIANTGLMTVISEGNAVQTSVQQGLCKFFSNIIGTSTISTRDSFNQSSIADRGTGDYDFFFTNSMGNDDYSQMSNADSASGHICMNYSEGEQNAGGVRVYTTEIHANNPTDSSVIMASVHGDLA